MTMQWSSEKGIQISDSFNFQTYLCLDTIYPNIPFPVQISDHSTKIGSHLVYHSISGLDIETCRPNWPFDFRTTISHPIMYQTSPVLERWLFIKKSYSNWASCNTCWCCWQRFIVVVFVDIIRIQHKTSLLGQLAWSGSWRVKWILRQELL
jgi:hypothetical protein